MTAEGEPAPSAIATLFPGYFALVMATGIIAVGAAQQDLDLVAEVLFAVGVVAFAVLAVLSAIRLVRYPKRVLDDLTHHRSGFAFLTIVAALNVLGGASALVHGWWTVAEVTWIVSLGAWPILLYPPLLGVILGADKPTLAQGINGTWFLLTVATESIAVVGALLIANGGEPNQIVELVTLAAFTLGLVLYLIVMTMLFMRWTFSPLSPDELQPPSWIAAGAVAITVLAGSNVLVAVEASPRLERLAPFVEGIVILAWATATFWFPAMVIIGVWRHIVRRVPLRYEPAYWSLIFPIGMYGAATFRMIGVTGFTVLDPLPKLALAAALVAWSAAALGLVVQLAHGGGRHRTAGSGTAQPASTSR